MYQSVIFVIFSLLLATNCQNVPGEDILNNLLPSSTSDPRDAFIQAIVDPPIQDLDYSELTEIGENVIGNFDRQPQAPTPSPPNFNNNNNDRFPPVNQFEDRDSFQPNVFEPPSRDRTRFNVDEFGNPLGDVLNTDTTVYDLDTGANPDVLKCPRNWKRHKNSCYKFNRSPPKRWDLAREICQSYRHDDTDKADLVSINDFEEHWFLSQELNKIDPEHRRWYLSTRQENKDQWINQGDQTQMLNLQDYFHDSNEFGELEAPDYKKDHLVYAFSLKHRR